MAEPSRSNTAGERGLTADQIAVLLAWLRPIQRSLALEAERGFENLQGRQQRFHQFLQGQLAAPPELPLPPGVSERMNRLGLAFERYPQLDNPARRRLVSDARQWLHELRHRMEPSAPMAPPRLRIQAVNQEDQARSQPLDLDAPITRIHGVGPKLAGRLATLGLLLVRDLLRHYPRDHVDYSAMRRIEALVSGETATIVATIRRCNGFVSPRNPNLAIIDLQLQDLSLIHI